MGLQHRLLLLPENVDMVSQHLAVGCDNGTWQRHSFGGRFLHIKTAICMTCVDGLPDRTMRVEMGGPGPSSSPVFYRKDATPEGNMKGRPLVVGL